jgi:hypothetical protein
MVKNLARYTDLMNGFRTFLEGEPLKKKIIWEYKQDLIFFGCGSFSAFCLDYFKNSVSNVKIFGFCDSNFKKKQHLGYRFISFKKLKELKSKIIMITTIHDEFIKQIREQLLNCGFKAKQILDCRYFTKDKRMLKFQKQYEKEKIKEKTKESIIRNYFLKLNRNKQPNDIVEIIEYFEKHKFSVFPYEFTRKYHARDIDVFFDFSCKMYFVLHNEKKMYFPFNWSIKRVREYYNDLCLEQDAESPHCYKTKNYEVKIGDVIADVGAAEGIWALDNVEAARKIYIFECEQGWIKALQKTFDPWKEKVIFINKYVSNTNDKKKVTLDVFFKRKSVNFIKADIEGSEVELVEGSKSLFSNNNDLTLLLCTYHKAWDEKKLKEMLEKVGFVTEYSARYMLYIYDKQLKKPYIRHGLIRAKKYN